MPVRLNITIDEDVHERLKRELPAKGISRFGGIHLTGPVSDLHGRAARGCSRLGG